jgi:glycosyltransferase involved in cell wall biosynthesis
MSVHHLLDENLGAAGATLALGRAMIGLGAQVDFYGFDDAYPGIDRYGRKHGLQFPWRLARYLRGRAREYDAIDGSTGDLWPWLSFGRPGTSAKTVALTRSHGLEHIQDEDLRARARRGEVRLGPKYRLYNGSLKLWEVAQSIERADGFIASNELDITFARARFGVAVPRSHLIPLGISDALQSWSGPLPRSGERLQLAFVGSWIERKGIRDVIALATSLVTEGIVDSLRILGGIVSEAETVAMFPAEIRSRLRVVPRYRNDELPAFLEGADVLLHLSRSEGFSLALLEAMACGLAPVTTPVGVATYAITNGENGLVVPIGDPQAAGAAVRKLAAERDLLARVREAAKSTSREYTWRRAAERTLAAYASCRGLRTHGT